ncbi:MAG: hypothetical protein LBT05_16360 [Planctomycetaceae bacterium]|nr:hypothetical protein [Planctomycetaceae bacterium]
MNFRGRKQFVIILLLIAFSGIAISCTQISERLHLFSTMQENKPTLAPLPLSETGVVLDIYKIRVPYNRRELLEELWNETEEKEIPLETRNELYKHGLRQGQIAVKIPVPLSRLLDLQNVVPQRPFQIVKNPATKEDLSKRYTAIAMMKNQPLEFLTCDPIDELPVLNLVDGNVAGRVYRNAKGVILVTTDEQPDGSVIMKTVPEIHFGDESSKYISEGGQYKPLFWQSKLSFDQLEVKTKLLLGQWVIIGPDSRSPGGFGKDILSRGNGDPEQIIIAIRLVQTHKEGIYDRNDIPVLNISKEQIPTNEENTKNSIEENEQNEMDELSEQGLRKTFF